jgi:putative acetyltransferase
MLRIVPVLSEESLSQARDLFREYSSMPGVAPCVEDFEREVSSLPGAYAPPDGRLLLAVAERPEGLEDAVACGALRKLGQETCEMKRLYVRPSFRGQGAGRELAEKLITEARSIGYARLVLDTLPSMRAAHELYKALGFRRIPSYQEKPIPGALFFELVMH